MYPRAVRGREQSPGRPVDSLLHLDGQLRGNAGEPLVTELVGAAFSQLHRAFGRLRPLGDHADEMRVAALEASA